MAYAQYIPHLVIGLFALGFVLFLLSLHQLRRGRTGPYWRLRRAAGQRGGQLFLISMALFGIATAIAFFTGFAAVAINGIDRYLHPASSELSVAALDETTPEVTPSDTPTHTPTATAMPTQTDLPTATATATATQTPAASPTEPPTATITPTPTATFETALRIASLPAVRAPREDAVLRVMAAGEAASENGTPLNPRGIFPAGIRRIYFFFSYRNLDNGVEWSRILYRDGTPVQGSNFLWSLGEEGSSYFFFGNPDGYAPGTYRVELRLGTQVASEFEFSITEPLPKNE